MKKPLKKEYCKPFSLDSTMHVFNSKAYSKALEKYIEYQEKIINDLKIKISNLITKN